MCVCVCVCVLGGGGGGGFRGNLVNDCCANLIIAIMLISYVNSYIGKFATNRLKNKATIKPKMPKTPFSQRPVANS